MYEFQYLYIKISSTERDVDTCIGIGNLIALIKWNENFSNLLPCQYYCMVAPHWLKRNACRKKFDENYTKTLRIVLNKSWKQHTTKEQLYGQLPPISQTIQVIWARYTGHCCGSKNQCISDILLWIPAHLRISVDRTVHTDIHQLCVDTGCYLEDLPRAMAGRDGC